MEKFIKILNANMKEKLLKLEEKNKIYTDMNFIRKAIKEYVVEKNIEVNEIIYSDKQVMINFINLEVFKFMKENDKNK